MRSHHHGGAGVQGQADARQRGADARIFGDGTVFVLRHIEVSADEHPLTGQQALGTQVCRTDDSHERRLKS